MGRRTTNNPRKRESKSCGCPDATAKFRPGTKPTAKKAEDCICSWQYRYDGPDGRERALNRPTYDEAKAAGEQVKAEIRQRKWIDPDRGDITVDQLWAKWWPTQTKGKGSRRGDESMWQTHGQPQWGHWKIYAIEHEDAHAWVRSLCTVDEHGEVHGPLMPSSVRRVFRLLDAMLTYAVVTRRLNINPLAAIKLPEPVPVHPEKRRPPSAVQLRAVRRALPKHLRVLQVVTQETGLRWGEITGLRACWVDLDGARLHVREVIVDDEGTLRRKAYPKSEAGFRTVPLTPLAVRVLRGHMAVVKPAATLTDVKSGMHGEELVFQSRNNALRGKHTPLNPSTFRDTWHAAIVRAGVARLEERVMPDGKVKRKWWPNFHAQRKTFASRLHALGVPEAVVQEVLGHERAGSVTWLYTYAARDVAGQILAAMSDQQVRQRPFLRAVPESGKSPETEADSGSSTRLRAM